MASGPPRPAGERKQVTVLFSDVSGYTSMSEVLDPEEVQEITTAIFAEAARIVEKYEGHVDKLMGDAVMVVFGIPRSHEDDPIRAVKTAIEITEFVRTISPSVESRIGRPLSMHSGIATGLVLVADSDLRQGTEKVLGDTINLASRLTGVAQASEVVVSSETARQAEGYFTFERLEPTVVKGKAEPVVPFRVLSSERRASAVHRTSGYRAELVGRASELTEILEVLDGLEAGSGAVVTICGEAGTGKSRLIEEVKARADSRQMQWLEAHCHAFTQNAPYSPLIDLLGRSWSLGDDDSPAEIQAKVEAGLTEALGTPSEHAPYLWSLFGIRGADSAASDPEFWNSRLRAAVTDVFDAIARTAPTIVCLEDLHWADASTMDLLRYVLEGLTAPLVVLCSHRPPIETSSPLAVGIVGERRIEVALDDLPAPRAREMLQSLLGGHVPAELGELVQEKAEGNPFYLEELVNSLVESGSLTSTSDGWELTASLAQVGVPSTVQGVVSARIDRLEPESKRILQEAAVIGRSFDSRTLKRVSDLGGDVDDALASLKALDLIRSLSRRTGDEYTFKHVSTQEIAYGSLPKREREEIHERVGLAIEDLQSDRLSEHVELLAHHFRRSRDVGRAVHYLSMAGEKSFAHYAVEASHRYYEEAFELLGPKEDRTPAEDELLVNLLVEWSVVFYLRGDFRALEELLLAYEPLAEAASDAATFGMFNVWMGNTLWQRGLPAESRRFLEKALSLGEASGDERLIQHACVGLAPTCADLGLIDDAIGYGERACGLAATRQTDYYLYFQSLVSLQYACWYAGEARRVIEIGEALLAHGSRYSSTRSTTWGHYVIAVGHSADGDLPAAIEHTARALAVSADPYSSQFPKFLMGMLNVMNGSPGAAEAPLREVLDYCRRLGIEQIATPASAFLGIAMMSRGHLDQGMKMVEEVYADYCRGGLPYRHAMGEYIMGQIHAQIVSGGASVGVSQAIGNARFIMRHVPFASRKAQAHFEKAIELAGAIGAKGLVGQASMDLAMLHLSKGRADEARACLEVSVECFETCEAETFLARAQEALGSVA